MKIFMYDVDYSDDICDDGHENVQNLKFRNTN